MLPKGCSRSGVSIQTQAEFGSDASAGDGLHSRRARLLRQDKLMSVEESLIWTEANYFITYSG